jgi:hypothetical protein
VKLANTYVTTDVAEKLLQAVNNSATIKTFRWVNLLAVRVGNHERS